jgi:dihydrofolate reductase
MGNVILVMSMSLDGFITAANRSVEQPMGKGGEKLHEWAMDSEDSRNREILSQGISGTGAVIAGRRTYDDSIQGWEADGPTGPARLPVFVVSHNVPKELPQRGVYTFVDGIESALAQAKAAAGNKVISVMGGADIGQQFIKAGLIDEIQIHLVPILFGEGTRLFDHLGSKHIQLETTKVIETTSATHLRFRVIK